MYTYQIYKDGLEFLGITDTYQMASIIMSNIGNVQYENLRQKKETDLKDWENRYKVSHGLQKKEYKEMLKETQCEINIIKGIKRRCPDDVLLEEIFGNYIEKKKRLNKILKWQTINKKEVELDIPSAKMFPIENLIEFNNYGFAKCIWHDEKSPSLHWDKKRNKAHCFAGCGDFDSIDIYMKINNVAFNVAVKNLCQS